MNGEYKLVSYSGVPAPELPALAIVTTVSAGPTPTVTVNATAGTMTFAQGADSKVYTLANFTLESLAADIDTFDFDTIGSAGVFLINADVVSENPTLPASLLVSVGPLTLGTGVLRVLNYQSDSPAQVVSVHEAKQHLRIDHPAEDDYIRTLCRAAQRRATVETKRDLLSTTWDLCLCAFPADRIWIRKSPVQSIVSITYTDPSGQSQTVDPSDYALESPTDGVAYVRPSYGSVWPASRGDTGSVVVRFVSGYGDAPADVPDSIVQAIKLMIGHYYENREEVQVGAGIQTEVPKTVTRLLALESLPEV